MQLPNNWGYNRLVGFRPFNDLLRQLVDVTSKGGNILLNIGPDADGSILPQARSCLEKFADWMKVNSVSIHGTTASPFPQLPFDGRCTRKGSTLFLHVFQWPGNGKINVPIANKVTQAFLLADKDTPLKSQSGDGGATILIPSTAPDPIDSVIAVTFSGELKVLPSPSSISRGKPVEVSGEWAGREDHLSKNHVNDGNYDTIWAGPENSRDGWVQIDLGKDHLVSSLLIDEGPYQRCQEFEVRAQVAGEWKTITSGTVIGKQNRMIIDPVKARYFRLVILRANDVPTISAFELFGM